MERNGIQPRTTGCGYTCKVSGILVHAHRAIPQDAHITSLSLKFDGDKIYVRAVCHTNDMRVATHRGRSVGIDMGVNPAFLTASDGFTVPSPRYFRKNEKHTTNLQRAVGRLKRGSGNRKRKVTQLRAAQSKTARQRRDFHHKVALMLVTNYDVIVREDLQVLNMSRTPKPKPDPTKDGTYRPNGAGAKAGLNTSIHDAGWGTFFLILDAKAEEAGRQVVKVNPKHTSQKCEKCDHIDPASRDGRNFCCTRCHHTTDADEQASRTVLRLGLESWQDQTAHAASSCKAPAFRRGSSHCDQRHSPDGLLPGHRLQGVDPGHSAHQVLHVRVTILEGHRKDLPKPE